MSRDAYELLALGARYVFAGLMLLIALRAARLTAVDSRRAAKLRRLSPMTGLSGELVVLEGDGKAPRGMRYPVIREGMIGSARSCDVRIRHASVRRRHACFQLTEQGLSVRDHAGARLRDGDGEPVREMTLLDGDSFWVGRIHLLLVLSNATAAQSRRAPEELFATRREEIWDDEPAAAYDGERELPRAYDDLDAARISADAKRPPVWSDDSLKSDGVQTRQSAFDDDEWDEPSSARSGAQHSRRPASEDFEESTLDGENELSPLRSSARSGAPRSRRADAVDFERSSFGDENEISPLRSSARSGAPRSRRPDAVDFEQRSFDDESEISSLRSPARSSEQYSHRLASEDFERISDRQRRSVQPRASRPDAAPLPGISRNPARRDVEPPISRNSGQRHTSPHRNGSKPLSQSRVREGIRRDPEPPDDLFMDDL